MTTTLFRTSRTDVSDSVPRSPGRVSRLLVACGCVVGVLGATAPVAAAQGSASDSAVVSGFGAAVSGAGAWLGSSYGSTGPLASPLTQTLGSANGSVGNPGPVAPIAVTGSCTPSPAHPRPVVLLHGTYGNADQLYSTLGAKLGGRGYCVVAPTFGAYAFAPDRGALASVERVSGPQVAGVIDDVLARTGADRVDLVGFSQGAGVAGYVAKVLRPGKVANLVSVAGYWGGDPSSLIPGGVDPGTAGSLLGVANLEGLADLLPTGTIREAWYGPEGTPFLRGTAYTLIASEYDTVMPPRHSFPPDSATASALGTGAAVRRIVLQDGCAADRAIHDTIFRDPRVVDLVSNALDPERPVPVSCGAFA